jgi:hypothetical protein
VDDEIVIELSSVNSTGTVDLYINGEKYVVSDNQVIIKEGLIYGSYTVLAILNGDDNYLESSDIAVFNVYKITPEITAADIEILPGFDAIIKITSKDDITGIVNVKVNGKTYLFDVNDKIRMNGFIHTANPDLRFILERNIVDRIEFGNVFLSNRPVVNAVKIIPF